MTKEQKLEAIYEAMADKTLSEWCRYITNKYNELDTFARCDSIVEWAIVQYHVPSESYSVVQNYTIIWHPVRIGDVLDWFDKSLEIFLDVNNDEWHDIYKDIISLWWNKRLPIDYQSMGCVDFVYSLIQK